MRSLKLNMFGKGVMLLRLSFVPAAFWIGFHVMKRKPVTTFDYTGGFGVSRRWALQIQALPCIALIVAYNEVR